MSLIIQIMNISNILHYTHIFWLQKIMTKCYHEYEIKLISSPRLDQILSLHDKSRASPLSARSSEIKADNPKSLLCD